MTPPEYRSGRAFAVRSVALDRWDVGSFVHPDWQWPAADLHPFSSVVRRRFELVGDGNDLPVLEKISFAGRIKVVKEGGPKRHGRLFVALPGDLVLSKIRIKQGSVDVVSGDSAIAVSSEYPVYEPDRALILPAYLKAVIRSRVFRRFLEGRAHGGSSKTRIRVEELEQVPIPVPSQRYQQEVVALEASAVAAEHGANDARADAMQAIEAHLLDALGIAASNEMSRSQAFATTSAQIDRWGVSFNQLAQIGTVAGERYPRRSLGSSRSFLQYGTSVRSNDQGVGVPIVRMGNIINGGLDLTDMKHVELEPNVVERYALRRFDILINRTNSKELVGKSALFDVPGMYVFASYIIRVRVREVVFDPRFVVFVLNSSVGRRQIDVLSRRIIGQANINSAELDALLLPCPPLSDQRAIVDELTEIESSAQATVGSRREQSLLQRVALERLIAGLGSKTGSIDA